MFTAEIVPWNGTVEAGYHLMIRLNDVVVLDTANHWSYGRRTFSFNDCVIVMQHYIDSNKKVG